MILSATLDDSDLLAVLRDAGIGGGKPAKRGAPAAKEFPVASYSGGYRWPMDAGIVSSEFGPRWGKTHQGIDIAADAGVPIRAVVAGRVVALLGSTGHSTGPHLHFEFRVDSRPVDPRSKLPKSRF